MTVCQAKQTNQRHLDTVDEHDGDVTTVFDTLVREHYDVIRGAGGSFRLSGGQCGQRFTGSVEPRRSLRARQAPDSAAFLLRERKDTNIVCRMLDLHVSVEPGKRGSLAIHVHVWSKRARSW